MILITNGAKHIVATLQDIAKAAGVSGMTVSRVINEQFDYARPAFAARADNIRRLAREMGYYPNAAARSTRTGRFKSVALLLSMDRAYSELPPGLLGGLQRALQERDLHMVVASMPDEQLVNEQYVPRILRELSSDGLLINYNAAIPPRMIKLVTEHRLPAIWINSKQDMNCVYPDDRGGAILATEHLLGLGHRRISYVDFTNEPGTLVHYSAEDRYAGYVAAMTHAGLESLRLGSRADAQGGRMLAHVRAHLDEAPRPTALLCYSSRESRTCLLAAALGGIGVPGELSIMRFGAGPYEDMGLHFTIAEIPEQAVGRAAVGMLEGRLIEPDMVRPGMSLAYTIHQGQSTAPAPHHIVS